MKTTSLLLSSLNITEDDYDYKGLFILSDEVKVLSVDMSDLSNENRVNDIKTFFNLEEPINEIRECLMQKVMEKVHISSRSNEGENYEEKSKRYNT